MDLVTKISRFEIFLIELDPAIGSEIRKTRPCVIISPNEINWFVNTLIVAPMTSKGNNYPTRVPIDFKDKKGQIVLDQIRTVDKSQLRKRLGKISEVEAKAVITILQKMFAE